jgi:hypothetical protein
MPALSKKEKETRAKARRVRAYLAKLPPICGDFDSDDSGEVKAENTRRIKSSAIFRKGGRTIVDHSKLALSLWECPQS